MRSIFALALVSLISSVPSAFAATASTPAPAPTPGYRELKCRFEGRDFDQHEGLRCYVRVSLCQSGMALGASDARVCETRSERDAFEVRCTNGYELESRDFAVGYDHDNIWVNADERGRLATLRLKPGEDYRADLVITNRVARHLEGRCHLTGAQPSDTTSEDFLN